MFWSSKKAPTHPEFTVYVIASPVVGSVYGIPAIFSASFFNFRWYIWTYIFLVSWADNMNKSCFIYFFPAILWQRAFAKTTAIWLHAASDL
jgi:hypothetical protein